MKKQILLIATFVMLSGVKAFSQQMDSALVDSVKKHLPNGWSTSAQGNKIAITKKDSIWFYNGINAPVEMIPSDKPPFAAMKGVYKIEIRYEKRWSDKSIKNALKSNAEKMNAVYKKYNMDSIPNKMGDYAPRNADEEKRVEGYNKECIELQKTLIEIPNASSPKYSYYIKSSFSFPGQEVWPHSASSEVAEVETLFNQLLRSFK